MVEKREPQTKPAATRLSRRAFLTAISAGAAGAVLAACGGRGEGTAAQPTPWATPTRPRVLPSPMPGTVPAATPAAPGALSLDAFLQMSSVLTGVPNLDPLVGQVYLSNLEQGGQFEMTPAELYERAGFGGNASPTIAEVEQSGLFADEAARDLADQIISYWYTGIVIVGEDEQRVATFVDALAWKTLAFTKPLTICAHPFVWAERPAVNV